MAESPRQVNTYGAISGSDCGTLGRNSECGVRAASYVHRLITGEGSAVPEDRLRISDYYYTGGASAIDYSCSADIADRILRHPDSAVRVVANKDRTWPRPDI